MARSAWALLDGSHSAAGAQSLPSTLTSGWIDQKSSGDIRYRSWGRKYALDASAQSVDHGNLLQEMEAEAGQRLTSESPCSSKQYQPSKMSEGESAGVTERQGLNYVEDVQRGAGVSGVQGNQSSARR
jgi:hypothetical protein